MYKRFLSGAAAVVLAATVLPAAADIEYTASAAAGDLVFSLAAPAAIPVGDSGKTDGTETVFVSVEVKQNPGVQSWVLLLDYDSSALTYDSFTADAFTGTTVCDKGGKLVINDFENADNTATGSAITVAFKVKRNLSAGSYGDFTLSLDPDPDNFFNFADAAVTPSISTSKGALTIQKVNNIVPVQSVTLNKTSITLDEGTEFKLTASVLPVNATTQSVIFRSTDPTVATVDSTGKVRALKKGEATITAVTTDGGKTASCSVTVNSVAVTGVNFTKSVVELTEGETENLSWTVSPTNASNKAVSFTSTNSSIAKVNSSGKITAVGAGNCTITVTTADGEFKDTCTVTVKAKRDPFTVAFKGDNPCTLKKGSTKQLMFNVTPDDPSSTMDVSYYSSPLNWHYESSASAVASVDNSGIVTGLKTGTAVITATNPGYVDESNRMIPVSLTVNVTDSAGITSNLTAYKPEKPVTFKVTLKSAAGTTTIAQKTVSAGSAALFSGVADGDYKITVEPGDGNYAPLTKEITVTNGEYALNETIYLYGDINADGQLDNRDLANLQQIVSQWNVHPPYFEVADVTADGEVDTEDISRYQQFLSHWNVVFGS